jgi:hypothetical protein
LVPDVVIEPDRRELERGHEQHDFASRPHESSSRVESAHVILDVLEDIESDHGGVLRLR